ncbi:MAG: TonB-dependent receptor, partial [Daejeonella sp.]
GKYLMTINGRYDGASNLGAGYRFGFFPGVSVGWNLHREEFWKALPEDLLTLKLRASYGENGNISDLGDFQAQGTYGVGNQYFNNPAVLATVFPNPDLRWEQSRTFDFGFDMGLFNRRVSVIFDYYNRITDDLLTDVALPGSSGFSVVRTNLGSLGNRGVELELAAQVLSSASPFQWNVSFNAARVKSKILELPANGIENNRVGGVLVWDALRGDYVWKGGLQEGGRIGDMYSYRQIGVYATDADAAKAPVDMIVPVSTARPADGRIKYGGDVNWEDLDGNNIIDTRDQVYLGNPYPVWTGGFTNSFGYKNFNLYIRTDFATGHTINDTGRSSADGQSQGDVMPTKEFIEKMWKKQGDITNTPRYLWQNQQGNIARSSVYYQLGDYLALREVTLSYAIPLALLQKVKLSNFRLNLTGNNLHYFTKYKGLNPETGGNDAASYPVSRNFTFGANITF